MTVIVTPEPEPVSDDSADREIDLAIGVTIGQLASDVQTLKEQVAELQAITSVQSVEIDAVEDDVETVSEAVIDTTEVIADVAETVEEVAIMVATEPEPEPVIIEEPEPDKAPGKTHWLNRPMSEWFGNK